MTVPVLIVATLTAAAVYLTVRALIPAPRPLAERVEPYAVLARQRLDTPIPHTTATRGSVWTPIVNDLATALSRLFDSDDTLATKLDNAGYRLGVDDYRQRQLGLLVAGLALGGLLGISLGTGFAGTIGLLSVGGVLGLTFWRSRLDRRLEARRDAMTAEAYVICQLLAVYLRTGDTPQSALERLVGRTGGHLPTELRHALTRIHRGTPPLDVFLHLAQRTHVPAAAQLYRTYGAAWDAAGNPEALMSTATVLRSTRRQALTRRMTKRKTAMVLPLVGVIAPIIMLFIAAALPSLIFGR